MIIPISTQEINIGDIVINTRQYTNDYYIITIGHEFTVIGYNKEYSRFICEDVDNKLIVELNKEIVTKKVSLELAEKEFIFKNETSQYKKFILDNCPHKDYDYDDRERYDTCKLKKCYYPSCDPKIDCAKYLNKDDVNKSVVLLKHLRLNKIKKINK